MIEEPKFSWKLCPAVFFALTLNGCLASYGPQMTQISDEDLCYQYLHFPSYDLNYDNFVYAEVEYRTYYKGLNGCNAFAGGDAQNLRNTSRQRVVDYHQGISDGLRQIGESFGGASREARTTVKCFRGDGNEIGNLRPVVEFASSECPFGYTEVK